MMFLQSFFDCLACHRIRLLVPQLVSSPARSVIGRAALSAGPGPPMISTVKTPVIVGPRLNPAEKDPLSQSAREDTSDRPAPQLSLP